MTENREEIDMSYADGFVIPVPTRKLKAYRSMAKRCARIWRDHLARSRRD
jgi:uncharacterized protein YbaA (DUF1428 family)